MRSINGYKRTLPVRLMSRPKWWKLKLKMAWDMLCMKYPS